MRSYVYRIYPTRNQKSKFDSLYRKNTFLFNELLKEKKRKLENNEDEAIFIKSFIKQFDELKHGNFVTYLSTYHLVNQIMDKFHNKSIKEFPSLKNVDKMTKKIHFDIVNMSYLDVKGPILQIPKIGSFKARIHRPMPPYSIIRQVIIEKRNVNFYLVNFLVSFPITPPKSTIKTAVGLDYSSPHFFHSSDNELGDVFKVSGLENKRIKKLKRRMSKCVFKSKNYMKLRQNVEKAYFSIENKRKFLLNKASNYCLNKYDLVAVESLSLSDMSTRFHLGAHTYNNSYNTFLLMLKYKSLEKGKVFIKVPKYFPSTRICSNCGQVHERLKLSDRIFHCDCGFTMDRDLNAAINIKEKAITILKSTIQKMKGEKYAL